MDTLSVDRAEVVRKLPVGAEAGEGGVHFRVWAPGHETVEVSAGGKYFPLKPEPGGYFSGFIPELKAGSLYRYRLPNGEYPDPASRFQPEGPHGPSMVVDPGRFQWTDQDWKGVSLRRAVIYEMHVGTFTPEGTWEAAIRQLPCLRDTGITVIEVMPVADFAGRFGWGYDGVNMFAPTRLYGKPDDLRRFVDAAHAHGMAVILDVVYNHLGADGNYLGKFTPDYFTCKYTTDWGDAINFSGPNSTSVREYFLANAGYWISEYHMDGLRLDATQNVYDDSEPHILRQISERVREAAEGRETLIVGENEPQHTKLVRPVNEGGYGLDALWNDDLHHSAVVALTGHNDAYYTDYEGRPQEFVSAMKYGYLYQGQRYKWQKKRRGTPTFGISPSAFVTFLENHDQVANSARGLRMHRLAAPGVLRAMTTLILLGPGTPMLLQGQEFGASAPFYYFADVPENLAPFVREGRKEFMCQWRSIRQSNMAKHLKDPCLPNTFVECKLDFSEREKHRDIYELHVELLRLRREDPVFSNWEEGGFDGAVLSDRAFLLRAFSDLHGDRLIVVNLGTDLHLNPAPEPLLAPREGMEWGLLLSTEEHRFGGCGTARVESRDNWRIPGNAAVVLQSIPASEEQARGETKSDKESER